MSDLISPALRSPRQLELLPSSLHSPGRPVLLLRSWALIHAAISSVARTAIIPMQDVPGLGTSARMNTPATQLGKWRWRIPSSVSFDGQKPEAEKLRDRLALYNRL